MLMVENLNMMFREIADSREAGWRLRKTLQTEPRIVLLASATSRFDEIDHPGHALYDLFRALTLRPLDTNECAVLWEAVSGRHRPPETIRSLEILTGGSPRLLAIVARFGGGLSFRELMADLLDLVDDHTEYFKGHLESLPPRSGGFISRSPTCGSRQPRGRSRTDPDSKRANAAPSSPASSNGAPFRSRAARSGASSTT